MSTTVRISNPGPTEYAAIYVRRSHKDAEGSDRNGRSLAEQEAECHALAVREGLAVVRVFAEREGTGASARSRKPRPVWEAALQGLRDGKDYRTLIVWSLDRADRSGAARIAALLSEHADGSRQILGVDGTDTGDERQRLATIIRAEMARAESENIAKRVERAKRAARDHGFWLGGNPPYGLRVVSRVLQHDPDTYPTARRIAEEALAGRSLWQIVEGLNADGVPSPSVARKEQRERLGHGAKTREDALGRGWGVGTVSQILRSPAFAGVQGRRERTQSGGWKAVGEVYYNASGDAVPVGVGVISLEERREILKQLDSRTRERSGVRRGRKPVSALMSGMVVCGLCGGSASVSGSKYRSYRCGVRAAGRDCGGFTAPVEAVDQVTAFIALRRLAAHDPHDALLAEVARQWTRFRAPQAHAEFDRAREKVDEVVERLERIQDLALRGVFTPEEAATRVAGLREQQAEAEEAAALTLPPAVDISPLLELAQTREAWDKLPLADQRAVVRLMVKGVSVSRASGRGARFEPHERMVITWADGTTCVPPIGT